MILEKLKPNKISDVVSRMDEYLKEMEGMEHDDIMEFVDYLENYIREYFADNKLEELELKKTAVGMIDETYIKLMNLHKRDVKTDGYFGIVLNRFFWELTQKNIFIFYIIDNVIRDDRFKLLIELMGTTNFSVVYPYKIERIDYIPENSRFPVKEYKEVEEEIYEGVKEKKHLLYVEKDDSINYLSDILSFAEDLQYNEYLCVFRNQSIETHKSPIWLSGFFSDSLGI